MTDLKPTTFTDVDLSPCRACGSDLGPFVSDPDGRRQVICSTCGARGPYEKPSATAESLWNTREPIVAEAAKLLLEQVEAVQDAYTRWMLSRAVGDPDMEHREARRFSAALFDMFDGGPEPDDQPCALVAALRALAEGRE